MKQYYITILSVTLLLKSATFLHKAALLEQLDDVLHVKIRFVLIIAVVLEAACLAALLRVQSNRTAAIAILCFIVPASLYRLAGTFFGAVQCPCLGSLTGWWPWLATNQAAVLNVIASWMFLSAVLVLARNPAGTQTAEGVVAA